jgi:hypothetical protein
MIPNEFYKSNLERELLIAKIKRNPSLYHVFKKQKDLTKEIDEDIEQRSKGDIDSFNVILCEGLQGGWKSSLSQTISQEHDGTFHSKRIGFEYQEFRSKLENSKKGEFYILDEEIFQHGIGSSRIIESVQTAIETLRQHGASMIFLSPNPKYFPENIFTLHLETIDRSITGTCKKNSRLHEIRQCESRPHKIIKAWVRAVIKKEQEYIGFYIKEIKIDNPTWNEYYEQKKIFTKKVLTEDFKKIDYEKIARTILRLPFIEDYKTKKQLMLILEQEHPNFSVGEKELIIAQIQIMRRQSTRAMTGGNKP